MKMYDALGGKKKAKGTAFRGEYMGPGAPKAMPKKRPAKGIATLPKTKNTRARKKMV
jgi:hypothetical protein